MTNDRINPSRHIPVANARSVVLDEVCRDSEDAMICAGHMRIASFSDRAALVVSDWVSIQAGALIATERLTFDIRADDPQHADPPPLTAITEFVPAKTDRLLDVNVEGA